MEEADHSVTGFFKKLSSQVTGGGGGGFLSKIGKDVFGGSGLGYLKAGGFVGALVLAGKLANDFGAEILKAREEAAKLGKVFNSGLTASAEVGLIRFSRAVEAMKESIPKTLSGWFGGLVNLTLPASSMSPEKELAQENQNAIFDARAKVIRAMTNPIDAQVAIKGLEGIDRVIAGMNFELATKGFARMAEWQEKEARGKLKALDQETIGATLRNMGRAVDAFNDPLANQSRQMLLMGATADQFKEAYAKWGELEKLTSHKAAVAGFGWAGAATAGSAQAGGMIANAQLAQTKFGMGLDSPEERVRTSLENWFPLIAKAIKEEKPLTAPNPP